MKKILLLFFLCSFMYGQKLVVTPNGLRSSDDLENSYVIIPVEGKTANELYSSALKYIHTTYKNPESVIKGNIENEFLSFSTHQSGFMIIKVSFLKVAYSIDYTCALSFKDGKVKFEIASIEMYEKGNFPLLFKGQGALSGYYIYNNKDELKRQDAKDQLESFINMQILILSDSLKNNNNDEKW